MVTGDVSLRSVAASGGRWGAVAAVAEQSASVVTTALLARLLTPADFGVVAAAAVVVQFVALATRFGFGAAVTKDATLDRRAVSSLFWVAGALATAATLIAIAAAGPLASAVGVPHSRDVIAALVAVLPLNVLTSVVRGLLYRTFRYGALAACDTAPVLAYGVVAIALAAAFDIGVWAVVIGRVAAAVVEFVLTIGYARFLPAIVFDVGAVRRELGFSFGYLGNFSANYAAKNLDYVAVGRMGGRELLGPYYVAYVLPNVLRQRLTWLANDVCFPILANVKDDAARMVRGYMRVARLQTFVAVPMLLGIAAAADEILEVFFGDRWSAAVVPLRLLAVAALIESLTQLTTTTFLALGKPSQSFRINLIRLAVLLPALLVAAQTGETSAVATAVVAAVVAAAVAAQVLLRRWLVVPARDLARAVGPQVVCGLAMVLAVVGARTAVEDAGALARLVLLGALGAAVYLGGGLVVFRSAFGECFAEARGIFQRGERPPAEPLEPAVP